MSGDQLEDYVTTVLDLRKEYEKDIHILLGLEVEYFPKFFAKLQQFTSAYPIDYFLLGQHFLGSSLPGTPYAGAPTNDTAILTQYCNEVIEALGTGCFTYLAHPDLIRFTGDSNIYTAHMRRLCQSAKAHNIPLEINFLGLLTNRHYPRDLFWQIAGEESCDVIFGLDAHNLTHFEHTQSLAKALQIVEKYHLHLLHTVPLRNPFR